MFGLSNKLVLVLARSVPMIEASKKDEIVLKRVPFIHYLLHFRKDIGEIKALLDFGSGLNVKQPAYTAKIGLKVCFTDVGAQKINGSIFKTF